MRALVGGSYKRIHGQLFLKEKEKENLVDDDDVLVRLIIRIRASGITARVDECPTKLYMQSVDGYGLQRHF